MHVSVTLTATPDVHVEDDPEYEGGGDTALAANTPGSTSESEAIADSPGASTAFAADEPIREGMYGPMHWLDDRHVTALLAPYVCGGWDLGDYARFADLGGSDARRLLRLLPPPARGDRQNNAPSICDLLRAAARTDGLTLEGYMIRAPRWDERISVDTVCVPETQILTRTGQQLDDEACPSYQHWLGLVAVLGLDQDATPPDDMRFLVRDASSARWLWAWWD